MQFTRDNVYNELEKTLKRNKTLGRTAYVKDFVHFRR